MFKNERFPLIIQRILSPWLKKILSSTALKCSRMNDFYWLLREFFHHGWRIFELYCSEMLQNERFPLITQRILSPWLKKILSSAALKCSRMNDFHWLFREFGHHGWKKFGTLITWNAREWAVSIDYSENLFTMVEEKFDLYCSKMLPNERFSLITQRILSAMSKKNFNSNFLKGSRMNNFHWLIREFFQQCWKKSWTLMLWNTPNWRISIGFQRICSP